MNQMTPIPATQQIAQLERQLLEAYIAREQADEKIKAIRNVMSGVSIGVELQKQSTPATEPAPVQ